MQVRTKEPLQWQGMCFQNVGGSFVVRVRSCIATVWHCFRPSAPIFHVLHQTIAVLVERLHATPQEHLDIHNICGHRYVRLVYERVLQV